MEKVHLTTSIDNGNSGKEKTIISKERERFGVIEKVDNFVLKKIQESWREVQKPIAIEEWLGEWNWESKQSDNEN